MTERILPGIGLTGYIDQGAPWKVAGDQNWLLSSVLTQLAVESATTSLPASPLNGVIYIVPVGDANENQIAARDNGAWDYFPPQEGWTAYVRDTGVQMNFDGAAWVPSTSELEAAIAAADGVDLLAYTAVEAQSILDNALPLQSYTALRAYTGRATGVRITTAGVAGTFWRDASDTTSADNGGTIIVDGAGRRWKRLFTGAAMASWFGVSAAASAAVNTPLMQAALDAADHVIVGSGVFNTETLTMSRFGATLELPENATLYCNTPTTSTIITAADLCSIVGPGTLKNNPVFNGVQGEILYGVVYATGNGLTMRETRIDGVPKCGINFKNSTRHRLIGVVIDGKVLKSSYNEADPDTLNNHAIAYDPPSAVVTDDAGVQIIGCDIGGVIQGTSAGNFGPSARSGGLIIQGNVYRHCWDHGTYLNGTASNYSLLNGNSFYECRRPVVSGGIGASVVGNTAIGSTNDATMEQIFSIRDAINCNVSDNIVLGFGATIDCRPLLGSVTTGNKIDNNIVKATGVSSSSCVIRVGGTTCESNVVTNNIAEGYPGLNFATIFIDAGKFNVVDDNQATSLNTNYILNYANQESGSCSRNRLYMNADAASALTVVMHRIDTNVNCELVGNSYAYKTGGANVTLRAQSFSGTQTGNTVTDNRFELTAASLVGVTAQFNLVYTTNNCARNWLSRAAPMCASFGWSSGTASVTVTNANVVAGSTVAVIPVNAAAGTVQKTNGVHVVVAAGSFQVLTSDGANTAATSTWRYEIR